MKLLLLFLLFVTTFFIVNFVHFSFFEVSVVLYALIFDIFISSLLFTLITFKNHKAYYKNSVTYIFFILFTINLLITYSILVPTAIDRSLSIYMLEKIHESNGPLDIQKFETQISETYFYEMDVFKTRVNEQKETGSIKVENNEITLTKKGEILLSIFKFVKTHFLPKKKIKNHDES
jgi:hypothetical protein